MRINQDPFISTENVSVFFERNTCKIGENLHKF